MSINLPQKSVRKVDDGNILKRRLLGAAVLIALAVIFLPLLLDGSGSESRFRRVERLREEPPRILGTNGKPEASVAKPQVTAPVVPETKPPQPAPVEEVKPKAVQTPKAEVTQTEPAMKKVTPATVSDQVTNLVAYVVQAGSFTDETNAVVLRDQLRQSDFPAFVSPDSQAGVYRVKVGPITDQQQAVVVQQRVESILGIKTLIRQYR